MKMTPAVKGQLTKALKSTHAPQAGNLAYGARFNAIRPIFAKHMPAEQAKHAARKYLASI
jgi:hypothetical protein